MEQTSNPNRHNMPPDLIIEIFRNLPVKSLCRFKSVSKSLHATIKHPSFTKKIRPKTLMQWQTIFDSSLDIYRIYQDGHAAKLKKFEFDGGLLPFRLANGLICYQDCENRLSLFNPTTEKLISLPQWDHYFDFGYVPNTNQYKLLGFKEGSCEFQILTLGKDSSWKKVANTLGITFSPDYPAVNGNEWLYWFNKHEARIVSFNLVTEEFRFVGLPKEIDLKEFEYSIFEFEGDLCFVEQPDPKTERCNLDIDLCFVEQPDPKTERCNLDIVNMWMLKDRVKSVWVPMLKNVVMPLEGTDLEYFYIGDRYACSVVCASGGEVMVLAADTSNAWIFSWDFLSGALRRIRVGDEQCCINMASVRKYVENDVDLKQFRPRRAKAKRGGGIALSSQQKC